MTYAPVRHRPALGSTSVATPSPAPGRPQPPIYPLIVGNNGSYNAARTSPAQGSCGTKPYPCHHPGTDVVGMAGTPVAAPETGIVVATASGASSPFGGYGPWVVVIHGDDSGKYHLLGHLDPGKAGMAPMGLRVAAGQIVGATSSANHTHWEVRKKLVPNFAANETNFDNNEDPVMWLRLAGWGSYLVIGSAAILALALWRRRHG